jgi:hypothetical protein
VDDDPSVVDSALLCLTSLLNLACAQSAAAYLAHLWQSSPGERFITAHWNCAGPAGHTLRQALYLLCFVVHAQLGTEQASAWRKFQQLVERQAVVITVSTDDHVEMWLGAAILRCMVNLHTAELPQSSATSIWIGRIAASLNANPLATMTSIYQHSRGMRLYDAIHLLDKYFVRHPRQE